MVGELDISVIFPKRVRVVSVLVSPVDYGGGSGGSLVMDCGGGTDNWKWGIKVHKVQYDVGRSRRESQCSFGTSYS